MFAPTFARENVTGVDLVENLNKASPDALGIPHCDARAQLLVEVKKLRHKAREFDAVPEKSGRHRAEHSEHRAEHEVVNTHSVTRRSDRCGAAPNPAHSR